MFFPLWLICLRFSCFWESQFWRGQRSQFESNTFSKKMFAMEVLGICLPFVKRYFQEHQWSSFFFGAQITHILLFSGMPVSERPKMKVWERHLFHNVFFYVSFYYVSTLCKKVFSAAPVKVVFPQGSNNSDFVVFGNVAFGEIKGHSLSTIDFLKVFLSWTFSLDI